MERIIKLSHAGRALAAVVETDPGSDRWWLIDFSLYPRGMGVSPTGWMDLEHAIATLEHSQKGDFGPGSRSGTRLDRVEVAAPEGMSDWPDLVHWIVTGEVRVGSPPAWSPIGHFRD